jgi:DNA replication protein DnaC
MSYEISELGSLKTQWLLRNSNIPRRFIGMDREDLEKYAGSFPNTIDKWLDQALDKKIIKQVGGIGTTGVGLLFDGSPGLGKTTHAVVTAMEFLRRLPEDTTAAREVLGLKESDYGMYSRPIYYMTYPEFLARKKAMFDADPETKREMFLQMEGFHGRAKEDHMNVRVLVLDDLGKEYKGSGFNDASFDEILRSRYDRALPTIVTTNVLRKSWKDQYGEAMGSFAFEAFRKVDIIGEDRRRTK